MTKRRQFRITAKLLIVAIVSFIVSVLMIAVILSQAVTLRGRGGETGLFILVGVLAFLMGGVMLFLYRKRRQAEMRSGPGMS